MWSELTYCRYQPAYAGVCHWVNALDIWEMDGNLTAVEGRVPHLSLTLNTLRTNAPHIAELVVPGFKCTTYSDL